MAIEDAARLSSLLFTRVSQGNLTYIGIDTMLQEFTAAQKARTNSICAQSEFLVRMHANHGTGRRIVGRYIIPFLHDAPAALSGLSVNGAAKLEFIDLPTRSLGGAWDVSLESIIRSLSCLRPKLSLDHFVYLLFVIILIGLARY